jgi:hypothetical protein
MVGAGLASAWPTIYHTEGLPSGSSNQTATAERWKDLLFYARLAASAGIGGAAGAIGAKYAMNSKVLALTERTEALLVGHDANAARAATSRGGVVQETPPLPPTPPPQIPSMPASEPIPVYGGRNAYQDAAGRWQ